MVQVERVLRRGWDNINKIKTLEILRWMKEWVGLGDWPSTCHEVKGSGTSGK